MDFFSLKTFGGLAIFGIIAACWDKVKFLGGKILSIAVVTVNIDHKIEQCLHYYCRNKFKRVRFNACSYDTMHLFSRVWSRFTFIPYEVHQNDSTVYLNGWRPIFINSFILGQGKGAEKLKQSFVVFRGTFDIPKLIADSFVFYEEQVVLAKAETSKEFTRFRIVDVVGQGNALAKMQQGQTPDAPVESIDGNLSNENGVKLGVYTLVGHGADQIGYTKRSKQPLLDYLYFPAKVMDSIKQDFEYWLRNERWYRDRGIPWKRGTLLFGAPGTGKSSLVRALGESYNLPIVVFHLNTLTNNELVEKWKNYISDNSPCIFLIEDIDNVFHGRDKAQADLMNQHVSFDCLLNLLDGADKQDGYYLFMTTNRLDQVDTALGIPIAGDSGYTVSTRPGRIDRVIELSLLDETGREQIANRIMGDIADPVLVKETIAAGSNDTPAQFLERCRGIAVELHIKNNLIKK